MSENEDETEAYRQMARLLQEKAAETVGYEYEDFSTAPVEEIVEAIKSSTIRKGRHLRRAPAPQFPHTIPFALEASETFDVGSDTGTGVNDADYETPFAFDGKLNSVTLKLLPAG